VALAQASAQAVRLASSTSWTFRQTGIFRQISRRRASASGEVSSNSRDGIVARSSSRPAVDGSIIMAHTTPRRERGRGARLASGRRRA
jgi:hypothetical protein